MNRREIRLLRETGLAMSQAELGLLLGVHGMTVSKWERGILAPSSYQAALMEEFRKAVAKKKLNDTVAAVLIGAGVAAALYLLLKNARG